jgi:hypothetical protein
MQRNGRTKQSKDQYLTLLKQASFSGVKRKTFSGKNTTGTCPLHHRKREIKSRLSGRGERKKEQLFSLCRPIELVDAKGDQKND